MATKKTSKPAPNKASKRVAPRKAPRSAVSPAPDPSEPRTVAALLEDALAIATPARAADVLPLVLEAWHQHKAPEIAAAVAVVGKTVKRQAIGTGGTSKHRQRRWLELADKRDVLDLSRLLEALTSSWAGATTKRVQALAAFPDDPRIAEALVRLIVAPPPETSADADLEHVIRGLLLRIGDPRSVETLAPHAATPAVHEILEQLRSVPPVPPLGAHERALCAQLEERFGNSSREAALLAAIYATPDDDGPRGVYADWLQERGDPRGEFIVLQLQPTLDEAARERVKLLLAQHAKAWLGPLSKLVTLYQLMEWSRGFLSGCGVDPANRHLLAGGLSLPEWSTVTTATFLAGNRAPPNLLEIPSWRQLRVLRGVDRQLWEAASTSATPHHLHTLHVTGYEHDGLEGLGGEWAGLPSLHRLELDHYNIVPDDLGPFASGALGRRLAELYLRIKCEHGGAWVRLVSPTRLAHVTLHDMNCRIELARAPDQPWTMTVDGQDPRVLEALARFAASQPPTGTFAEVVIANAFDRAQLAEVLAPLATPIRWTP